MREVNFSLPTANKASVGITTALYDRRALDCTSTLPLINSLNHLAYLTTSSSRIRDILTVDGGVERLVCILKEGRGKDVMDIWKWSLAFQCIVNIGVRGSESVRTRVVEADVVPVISTILDNYIRVVDVCRERAEVGGNAAPHKAKGTETPRIPAPVSDGSSAESASEPHVGPSNGSPRRHQHPPHSQSHHHSHRSRRNPPPNINIPRSSNNRVVVSEQPDPSSDGSPTAAPPRARHLSRNASNVSSSAPSSANQTPSRPLNSGSVFVTDSIVNSSVVSEAGSALATPEPVGSAISTSDLQANSSSPSRPSAVSDLAQSLNTLHSRGDRTPREGDRFVLIPSHLHSQMVSQPSSPTTPGNIMVDATASSTGTVTEPIPASDLQTVVTEQRRASVLRRERNSVIDIDPDIHMEDIGGADGLDPSADPVRLVPQTANSDVAESFTLDHAAALADQTLPGVGDGPTQIGFSPTRISNSPAALNVPPAHPSFPWQPRSLVDRHLATSLLSVIPRDDDVLMSLQLLAYVSKYCNLRTYFQNTHLVPRLKIPQHLLDAEFGSGTDSDSLPTPPDAATLEEEWDSEYLLPQDVNIFPLVEKFTIRHNSQEMQYWAGVVMRNLCRKDDSRGGIRQCAYYKCGKWEEFTRQFAKCRRCRRTKYCSKECQKNAWTYHRHWCVQAQPPQN